MIRACVLVVGVCLSILLGAIDNPTPISAADPPAACVKYECKNHHANWRGNNSAVVWAYFTPAMPPGLGAANDSAAIKPLYTPTSTQKLPAVEQMAVFIDAAPFAACTPKCGLDSALGGNGKWQAPQEVDEAGMYNPNLTQRNLNRFKCTETEGGVVGPQAENQTNDPDPGTPPGWGSSEPPPP